MYIITERLIIREFQPEDWKAVLEYTSDNNVMRYIPEGVFSEQQAKDFVSKNVGESAEKYPVLLKKENVLIGHIDFHQWPGEGTYEIGWVFHPAHHHKGFATEAARAILMYGFEKLDIHRIIATCQPQNTASYHVMEKIGMRREGHFKKCIPAHFKKGNSEWWDEYFYTILEEEWRQKKTNCTFNGNKE
ncbi:GNAT family N-acetyltransferase [Gracilibacillus xinjiangensis]|uniref:GNAT family N-acetyltransferase n=1 Tax=Gracilibacillus xinjiangensis TaxID=1193282 RepID=A0ABV8X0K8_9BACI